MSKDNPPKYQPVELKQKDKESVWAIYEFDYVDGDKLFYRKMSVPWRYQTRLSAVKSIMFLLNKEANNETR